VIPAFDANGNLPPGIYRCTEGEIAARFGQGSSERQVETSELMEFVRWARQTGTRRLLIDGSYITSKTAPNDVDVVILPRPVFAEVPEGRFPFLHVQLAADEADVEQWARVDFGEDRNGNAKGIVEVEL
jgi:hypothetical protein